MAYDIVDYGATRNTLPRTAAIRYIVVHYTEGSYTGRPAALANCQYFSRAYRAASAGYFIDDEDIYRYCPDDRAAWHCGDGHGRYGITNQNSIGIEVCTDGAFTDAEIDRLAFLVQDLMGRYGVPAERVVRHYDASRKLCPAHYVDEGRWAELHARITGGEVTGGDAGGGPGAIAEDGLWGEETSLLLQQVLGCEYVDGVISRQNARWRSICPGCTGGWQWLDDGYQRGSGAIMAVQGRIGVEADGLIGPATINALIAYEMGHGSGATVCDGRLDRHSKTIRQMQRDLNRGFF